jgi:hypothetical protein
MSRAATNRDWLDVRVRWRVYGLIDLRTAAVFYIGITNRTVPERLNQHRADRASAVWDVIRGIEAEGTKLGTALIIALPQIFNRTLEREGGGFWRHLPGDLPAWPHRIKIKTESPKEQ